MQESIDTSYYRVKEMAGLSVSQVFFCMSTYIPNPQQIKFLISQKTNETAFIILCNAMPEYRRCAADFSLLNLPKGKSLGRSKPATNF